MLNIIKLISVIALFLLVACDKAPTAAEKAPIPKVDNFMLLSKNEFEEIERRCIGVSHPTCSALPEGRKDRAKYEKLKKELGWD